jgi:Regulator of ribonuclease activity B
MGFLERLLRGKPPATMAETDQLVVRQLQGLGADLSQPRHVIHFLYFAHETDARSAANEIDRAGYDATVAPPDDVVEAWTVRAEGYRVIGSNTVASFRAWFEQVAVEFHGEYDGWEAASKP